MMLDATEARCAIEEPDGPFILVVDDHEPSLRCLRHLVEVAGYPCVCASSALDALVFCDAWRPLVVVTDLNMPRLDGMGLARWLKARYHSVPIILVTAADLDVPALAKLGRTFLSVFTKPLDVERFLNLIEPLMPAERKPEDTRSLT